MERNEKEPGKTPSSAQPPQNQHHVQLCIKYAIQLGTVALPKTDNPVHMESNADVDFIISDEDMDALTHMEHIKNYGDYSIFPVFNGKPLE